MEAMNGTMNITNREMDAFNCIKDEWWFANVISFFITLILGIIGNILVLLTVIGRNKKRTGNDLFIANVSVSDLALLVFYLPIKLRSFLICDERAPFPAYCSLIYPLSQLTFFVSIFTMTAMAIHRCRHVVNPFLLPEKRRHIYLCIALIWLMSAAIVLPLFIFTKMNPVNGYCDQNDLDSPTYTAVLFVFQLIIPLFIISVAYFQIWRDLSRSTAFRASINSSGQVTTNSSSRENKQVVRTIATIVIMFVICMLPNHIFWMIWDFGGPEARHAAFLTFKFAGILVILNSCINPIVYGSLTRHFRRGYYKYLCFFCHKLTGKPMRRDSRSSQSRSPLHSSYKQNKFKTSFQSRNTEFDSVKFIPLFGRGDSLQKPMIVADDVSDETVKADENKNMQEFDHAQLEGKTDEDVDLSNLIDSKTTSL